MPYNVYTYKSESLHYNQIGEQKTHKMHIGQSHISRWVGIGLCLTWKIHRKEELTSGEGDSIAFLYHHKCKYNWVYF